MTLPPLTPAAWDKALPWLRKACDKSNGELTPADLYRSLATDPDYQLIQFEHGAGVLAVQGDALHIQALAGDFEDKWVEAFNDWLWIAAAQLGCTRATLCGRKGWSRRLKRLGWKQNGEFLEVTYGRWRQQ